MKKLLSLLLCLFLIASAKSQDKPEGLFINSKATDFKAKDQTGAEISLKELRKKGPVVIVFYRGFWCPYCNKELRRFSDSLDYIFAKGATLVAITPEGKEGVDSTAKKTGAAFTIISDQEMKISSAYGVNYKVDERTEGRYLNAGINLKKINAQKEVVLPVPAVYIINKDGYVTYRFFEADYKKRPWVKDIIEALGKTL
jgi:peroxiredoxin